MVAIANSLEADRCFLYVRDPETRFGQVASCYCRNPEVPYISKDKWQQEPADLLARDPMFQAALNCQSSIYVDDVETANPQQVNRDFEAEAFGHRALIHAHICEQKQLWGVLQPSVFNRPRQWTTKDRQVIETVLSQITTIVKQYVQENINLGEYR